MIILLSDGANTAGVIEPLEAAKLAAESNVTIYTVGVGAEEMIQKSFFGNRKVNPSQDLDERMLTKIADMTGGNTSEHATHKNLNTSISLSTNWNR